MKYKEFIIIAALTCVNLLVGFIPSAISDTEGGSGSANTVIVPGALTQGPGTLTSSGTHSHYGNLSSDGRLFDVGPGTGATSIRLNGGAGSNRFYECQTAGNTRWQWGAEDTAEGGSETGSNWELNAYDDSGVFIDTVWSVARATSSPHIFYRDVRVQGFTYADLTGHDCVSGEIHIDTGGANYEWCFCSATNTWRCAALNNGVND